MISSFITIGFFIGTIVGFLKGAILFAKARVQILIWVLVLPFLFFATLAFASSGWLIYDESAFKGKVIDADTKKPIEGAVVVAVYHINFFGPAESGSVAVDVQETLTDSNGEYNIPRHTFFNPWPFSLGGERTTFIIYKPGYGSYPKNYSFFIYPVKETLKVLKEGKTEVRDMEGIVFKKRVANEGDKALYREKFGVNKSPLIPLKSPFERVRNLDLPFDVDVINAEPLRTIHRKPFKTYPVIGLSKLKTRKERLRAIPGSPGDIRSKKLPLLYKAINEERKRFGLSEVGKAK